MNVSERSLLATSIGGLTALGLAGVLLPVRGLIHPANVALALAVVVVVAAALGGRLAGAVTAAVAALSFDFLHTVPYGSLEIAGSEDVLTTVLLLALGVLAGGMAERLRRARHRRSEVPELERLHRVADRACRGDTAEDLTLQVSAELLDALHLRDCWYEPAPFLGTLQGLPLDGPLPRYGVAIPLLSRGAVVGRFVLAPDPGVVVSGERRMLADALVEQLGMVLAVRAA